VFPLPEVLLRVVLLPLAMLALWYARPPAAPEFGAAAVWQPKPGEQQAAFDDMRQCGAMHAGGSAGAFESCVGEAMRKHGAPPAAIAFNGATGGNAYATRFVESGRVDVMETVNPFLANSNDQLYFVNGVPGVISADDEAMRLDARNNPGMRAMNRKYPEAFIFPHAEAASLKALPGTKGAQSFTLVFPIVNGCHACERVGQVTIEFMFDASGRYLGARLIELRETRQ